MTVKQLKELLNTFDENLEVLRIDNSYGYEEINHIQIDEVVDLFTEEKKTVITLT